MSGLDWVFVSGWLAVAAGLAFDLWLIERGRRKRAELAQKTAEREAEEQRERLAAFWKACTVKEEMREAFESLSSLPPPPVLEDEYSRDDSTPTIKIAVASTRPRLPTDAGLFGLDGKEAK